MSFKRKKSNDRNVHSNARIAISVILFIMFFGLLVFLLFGGDKVPGQIKLPFDLPDTVRLLSKSSILDEANEKAPADGVDDNTVISDQILYADTSSGWKHSNVKVLKHDTDAGAGLDTVTVYMELENEYVIMAGTKEVTYRYNPESETWEAVDISKLSAMFMVPVNSSAD